MTLKEIYYYCPDDETLNVFKCRCLSDCDYRTDRCNEQYKLTKIENDNNEKESKE